MPLLNSSSKKKSIKLMRSICLLPPLPAYKFRRRNTRQATHASAVHSLPEESHTEEPLFPQSQAANSENIIFREPSSPSNKDYLKKRTHMNTPCLLAGEFEQLNVSDDCDSADLEDPLPCLLSNSRSPLSTYDDTEKLAWLRSQLIGENQEFLTPFGKRLLIYADHTASGRSLLFIENFIAQYLLPFYGNTHTYDSYVGGRTSTTMKQAEEYIKERLGGTKDDVLLMCGWGCTAAIKRLQEVMGIAVPSILRTRVLNMMSAASPPEERWLVFTGPYEHHSNLLSWRQSLAEVIEIPANEEGKVDMDRLEQELQGAEVRGRVLKMGAFSACSNVTGLLTDTRAIASLLHKHGALACFDFASSAPHLPIEVRSGQEDGYDAVVMSPHKLLGGPGTPGILLMRKSLYKLGKHPPSTCGGGTVAYVNGFNEKDTLYYEGIEEREEGGTPPIVGKVRCALAFWVKEMMGHPMIRQRETMYMNKAIKRLYAHPNIRILGGQQSNNAPILSFLINVDPPCRLTQQGSFKKPLHGRFVVKVLNDLFGIQARGGCACAGPYGHLLLGVSPKLSLAIRNSIQKGYEGLKPGWARVSLCYSMTEEEVEYILSAIDLVATYGQRYLALYDFDWHTGNWTHVREKAFQQLTCHEIGQLQACTVATDLTLPENNRDASRRLQFRRYLRLAKALAHLLPKHPPPKPVPDDIDACLLLFHV